MFGLFKKKSAPQPATARRTPRGVLLTSVTDTVAVLSKAAPTIRNTYEVRLALYMAKSRNLRFVLAVRSGAKVEASVRKLLDEHGGTVEEVELDDYCVSVGWGFAEGEEDGWSLGDAAAFDALVSAFQSPNLKRLLQVGANISAAELDTVATDLAQERVTAVNIDGENVREAILALVASARKKRGILFVQ